MTKVNVSLSNSSGKPFLSNNFIIQTIHQKQIRKANWYTDIAIYLTRSGAGRGMDRYHQAFDDHTDV